jgi:ribose-phosphate pyrophosphokinase
MRGEEIAYYGHQDDQIHFVNVDRYPDGSPMVKHTRTTYPSRILLRPRDSAGFLGGIFWVQSLMEQGCHPPDLVIPCLFGQRQNRINPTGDTLFTAKSVGKIINSLGCRQVTVLDPHSDVSSAVIDRCRVVHVDEIWKNHKGAANLDGYAAVIAADAGGIKRAKRIANLLQLPLKVADKTRDVSTGKVTGFKVEDLSDLFKEGSPAGSEVDVPKVLVVDDLSDGGGTFVGLGEVLDAEGVDADLFVTHGLFTKGTRDLSVWYRKIICTDSVAAQRPDVEVLFTAEQLLKFGGLRP